MRKIIITLIVSTFLSAYPAIPTAPIVQVTKAQAIIRDIAFPLAGAGSFRNDYLDPREAGTREHLAIDIAAAKMTMIVSATDGVVTSIAIPEKSWGYAISIRDNDGFRYSYLHINNDTPGTDDGQGGIQHAYAPGIEDGTRVVKGQHIAWVGDSGNAENTISHLHFEMRDPNRNSINPYDSLVQATATSPHKDQIRIGNAPTITHTPPPDLTMTIDQNYDFTFDLSEGMSGNEVRQLQLWLQFMGYFRTTATGYFGPITKTALLNFQAGYGLPQTGVADLTTRTRLNQDGFSPGSAANPPGPYTTPPTTPTPPPVMTPVPPGTYIFVRDILPGRTNEDVRQLQIRLTALGFYAYSITGYYGPITKTAVINFQKSRGITPTGVVSTKTRAALNS